MSLCLGMTALNALSVKFFCKLRYILKTLKKTFYTMTFKLQIDYFFFGSEAIKHKYAEIICFNFTQGLQNC